MFRPRVIPCLLLQGLGLVKTVGFKKPTYIGDPINAVKIFNESEADELVFLDISATREKRIPSLALIESIADEAYMPFAVGGGITTFTQISEIIARGAEKVVLCTSAIENPTLITEGARVFGDQCIVVALDIRRDLFGRYRLYTHGGSRSAGRDPVEFAREAAARGAGEIFINAIHRDGTLRGYDLELVQRISGAVRVPVIACGGAGSLAHLTEVVQQGGASAAAAGSLFVYHGPQRGILINYPSPHTLRGLFSSP